MRTMLDGYQIVMDGYKRGLMQLATHKVDRTRFYTSIAEDAESLHTDWENVGNDLLVAARRYGEEESRRNGEECIAHSDTLSAGL